MPDGVSPVQPGLSYAAPSDPARTLLRHTLATLAYRAGKVLRDAPASFADFTVGPTTRTPLEIVAHMGDLFDWALTMAQGRTAWRASDPRAWGDEVARLFARVSALDEYLAGPAQLAGGVAEGLFQGPVADALTHTGQLALLRRLAGRPVRGEGYHRADIVVGRTGLEQAPPRLEFD